MTDQSLFINKAYQEALAYADKAISQAAEVKKDYTEGDSFYSPMDSKDIAFLFFCLAAGIAALIFKKKLLELIYTYILVELHIPSLLDYLSMLYTVGFIILLIIGAVRLLKFVYIKKTDADLSSLDKIAAALEKEKEPANELKNTILNAITKHDYVKVGNPNNWEEKINAYQAKSAAAEKNTSAVRMWGGLLGYLISFVVFYFVFSPYMIKGLAGAYTYSGTMAICASYLLLLCLIYKIQLQLVPYNKVLAKLMGFILFGLFQAAIILSLNKAGGFVEFADLGEYTQGNDPDWFANIITFSLKYHLFSKASLTLIIVSIIGFMNFIRTNPGQEAIAMETGIDIPMDNGNSNHITVNQRWSSILWASLFVIVAPFIMSRILLYMSSGTITFFLFYVLIGLIWSVISSGFTDDAAKVLYGKRLTWVKNAYFFSYLFLTLALSRQILLTDINICFILLLFQTFISSISVGIALLPFHMFF